jgi:predicted ATPase/class 3 adenylate cyclase
MRCPRADTFGEPVKKPRRPGIRTFVANSSAMEPSRGRAQEPAALKPTGTLTFLFSDIEGSTTRWETHRGSMATAVARHDAIMRSSIEACGGYVFKTVGDAFCAVFRTAREAIGAALDAQRALAAEDWSAVGGLRVRMALHTGAAEERDGDYFGTAVNRVARLLAIVHGGQTVVSGITSDLARDVLPPGAALRDLGLHALKDLTQPEQVYQLDVPDLPAEFPALRSPSGIRTNLPAQLTSFVGRERELADIQTLVQRSRFVTLLGAGGVGKTRLAVTTASAMMPMFPSGVVFIDLAPVSAAQHLPHAILNALGLSEDGRPLVERLSDVFAGGPALLVFDNCERVLPDCGDVIAEFLRAVPTAHVLATSRETLGVLGEVVYRVAPLEANAAIALFLERARAVNARYGEDPASALQIERLCRGLDGIPLALELAASRANVLAPQQMAERLSDRLALVGNWRASAPPHHHTLRETLDWSFELLSDAERALFRRLAVFIDGWTLEAAEAVCSDPIVQKPEILDVLSRLVDKSLVVANTSGRSARFIFLETMREYAASKLAASGEQRQMESAHAAHYRDHIERLRPTLLGASQREGLEAEAADDANVVLAVQYALAAGNVIDAARVAVAASPFWWVRSATDRALGVLRDVQRAAGDALPKALEASLQSWIAAFAWLHGDLDEAATLNEAALATRLSLGGDADIAESLFSTARDAYSAADFEDSRKLLERALEHFRRCGDRHGTARALDFLGLILTVVGEHAAAEAPFAESLAIYREMGDKRNIAWVQYHRGLRAHMLGDFERAESLANESLAIWRDLEDQHGIVLALHNAANAVAARGDLDRAASLHRQSLELTYRLGLRKDLVDGLERLAAILVAQGRPAQAVRLLGAADRLREQLRTPVQDPEREEHDRAVTHARSELGVESFDDAWNTGRALSTEEVMSEAIQFGGMS